MLEGEKVEENKEIEETVIGEGVEIIVDWDSLVTSLINCAIEFIVEQFRIHGNYIDVLNGDSNIDINTIVTNEVNKLKDSGLFEEYRENAWNVNFNMAINEIYLLVKDAIAEEIEKAMEENKSESDDDDSAALNRW